MNRKRVLSTLFLPASLALSAFLPVTSYAQSYHAERATSAGTTYTQLTKYDGYICYLSSVIFDYGKKAGCTVKKQDDYWRLEANVYNEGGSAWCDAFCYQYGASAN